MTKSPLTPALSPEGRGSTTGELFWRIPLRHGGVGVRSFCYGTRSVPATLSCLLLCGGGWVARPEQGRDGRGRTKRGGTSATPFASLLRDVPPPGNSAD